MLLEGSSQLANDDFDTAALTSLQGDTPLHLAAQHASPKLVKLLLEHDSSPGTENLLVRCCSAVMCYAALCCAVLCCAVQQLL